MMMTPGARRLGEVGWASGVGLGGWVGGLGVGWLGGWSRKTKNTDKKHEKEQKIEQ